MLPSSSSSRSLPSRSEARSSTAPSTGCATGSGPVPSPAALSSGVGWGWRCPPCRTRHRYGEAVGKVIDGADRAQQRWTVLGYPIAVIYKYFDDQGNYLAAIITYYAFIAIFPLLLLGSSILGFFLEGDPERQQELLDSALAQFPIIGDQLGRPESIEGSVTVVIIGGLVALYGAMGLGQALQNALNIAWSVPRNSRPNPILLRLKSLFLLLTAGLAVVTISVLSVLASSTQVFDGTSDATIAWVIRVATVLIIGLLLTLLFRVAGARRHGWRSALPGAFTLAVLWQF